MGMPLTFMGPGECREIIEIRGKDETRRFLENLGFVTGCAVTVISKLGDNVIVSVKDSRVAISHKMANRIMV